MNARRIGLLQAICIGVLVALVWNGNDGWGTRVAAGAFALVAIVLGVAREDRARQESDR